MAVKTEPEAEPAEAPLPSVTKQAVKSAEALEKNRQAAAKSITEFRRATAWEIHRWPYTRSTVEARTSIHLPRSYLGTNGEDIKPVRAGTDINQFVHIHYMETVDVTVLPGGTANFVTQENVHPRRHEFLGPDPRVVGYSYDGDGEIHIKWWDRFLQDQWVDKQKWKFELVLNDEGQWVEKDA